VTKPIVVVGGGIVGLATARAILTRRPESRVLLVEKEAGPGTHQSGRNSGVLHAGLYYKPGSSKARLAVQGIRAMRAYCEAKQIPHEVCGKLVVAANETERVRLDELHRRGIANGLAGLRRLSIDEAREIEPHVGGVEALHVPEEGIVDYPAVCRSLVRDIEAAGGEARFTTEVLGLRRTNGEWRVLTSGGDLAAAYVINCAGLHSDRVAQMTGSNAGARIVPFRGEYYTLRPERAYLVRNLIYPVPDPTFPFLGVHFTRMIAGGIEAGPNAVLALKREGYTKKDFSPRDAVDALFFPGLWRFMGRYPSTTLFELRRAFSRSLFAQSLARLVPDVRADDLVPARAGVRAQAMSADGRLVEDFLIVQREAALHLINAPSPAATASLAIADEIADRVFAAA
jgi:(S)-2-hydroxyglutarate dehydrogenase